MSEPAGYFVVRSTEDGTRIDGPFSGRELEEMLAPDRDGYTYYGKIDGYDARLPSSCAYIDEGRVVIIKGAIVVPRTVDVVRKVELP